MVIKEKEALKALYADDIVLLAHSLNGMQLMLDICTNFGVVLTCTCS